MLAKKEILAARKKISSAVSAFQKKAETYSILAYPTRLKILYLLSRNKELCPSDISGVLNISISAVSHQLKLLHNFGFVERVKKGKMVCYKITKNPPFLRRALRE